MTISEDEKSRNILKELEILSRKIREIKQKLEFLKNANNNSRLRVDNGNIIDEANFNSVLEKDNSFEEEIKFYIENYHSLADDFNEHELKSILPKRKNKNYRNILLRLLLDSTLEIRCAHEFISKEISEEDINICNSVILKEQRKMNFIKAELSKNENLVSETEEENKIVLVPTFAGNFRVLDELEDVPREYYDGFLNLIKSIIDGTFKNVKMLTHTIDVVGIYEVKDFKIRVVFVRLIDNTYALITAFMKKSDNDKLYRESLNKKVTDFVLIKEKLLESINNPEFQAKNEAGIQKMWDILLQRNRGVR